MRYDEHMLLFSKESFLGAARTPAALRVQLKKPPSRAQPGR